MSSRRTRFYHAPHRLVDGKDVLCLEHVGFVARTEDLLLLALPLGVVDGVDPVLDLHDEAAVLFDDAGTALVTLGGLDGERT